MVIHDVIQHAPAIIYPFTNAMDSNQVWQAAVMS
jgi:hypothetical protein